MKYNITITKASTVNSEIALTFFTELTSRLYHRQREILNIPQWPCWMESVGMRIHGGEWTWQQEYWTGACYWTVPESSKGILNKRDTTALWAEWLSVLIEDKKHMSSSQLMERLPQTTNTTHVLQKHHCLNMELTKTYSKGPSWLTLEEQA